MKMVVLCGASGIGKSTYCEERKTKLGADRVLVVSADQYMVDAEGNYRFSGQRLGECHSACFRDTIEALDMLEHHELLVDNTNTRAWEISPYIQLANSYEAEVEVVAFVLRRLNAAELARRNAHGVPLWTILSQNNRLEDLLKNWPFRAIKPTIIGV